ncbi:MAG: hypothetical protein GY862_05935, partial [Gammaproteobacteria bacterium]|nr:hypothetical protein [Gammaproteobacteria bacterium]
MSESPYPGLRPFKREETDIFFGRDLHTAQLLDKLDQTRFVAVLGPSGCGKSSLVRTGLLAALEGGMLGKAGSHWRIADMRPGNRPFFNLAETLLQTGVIRDEYFARYAADVEEAAGNNGLARQSLEHWLRQGPFSIHELYDDLKLPAGAKLLLLADQFEEIFRYHRQGADDDAAAFVELLLAAVRHAEIYVILTMRSDFLGECALFHKLPEAINQGLYLTPRLDRDQLREAIEEPALVFDGELEPALLNRLLNDVDNQTDQLPVLQHALMRLWVNAKVFQSQGEPGGVVLSLRRYEESGGLKNILSNHANTVFEKHLDAEQQRIAQILLRALTELGPDNRAIRRPVKLADAAALAGVEWREVAQTAEIFRHPWRSFLTPPPGVELTPNSVLDISHESLIRQWRRLQGWVKEEAQAAELYTRLAEAAQRQQADQGELWHGIDLENILDWRDRVKPSEQWARRYTPTLEADAAKQEALAARSFHLALDFLERSHAAEIVQREAKERARRERTRLFAGFFIFTLLLLALAGWQWREAEHALAEVNTQQQRALLNQSRFLADKARQLSEKGYAFSAMRVALEALPGESESHPKRPFLDEAQFQLYNAVEKHWRGILEHDSGVGGAVFSPDGKRLLTRSGNNAYLWDIHGGRVLHILKGHEESVNHAAFSPNGKTLVTASWDDTVRLWDTRDGRVLHILKGHKEPVNHAAFSPDGKTLVTASWDGTARLWDTRNGQILLILKGHESQVNHTAFSPDGKTLVTASNDNTARLWDTRDTRVLHILKGHKELVIHAMFSPDGKILVTASWDGTARLWDTRNGRALHILKGHGNWIIHAAFSSDGKTLVTASEDNTARLWDTLNGRALLILEDHENRVNHAAFSPDGKTLVTTSEDNTARLWDSRDGMVLHIFKGHVNSVKHAAFSPDGKTLVTASNDNTARLWDTHNGRALHILNTHENVNYAAFSPDGKILVTASDDTARLWNTRDGRALHILKGHKNSVSHATFSPDSKTLISASFDTTARLWNTRDGRALHIFKGHEGGVNHAAFSPDGKTLVTASNDNTARLWNSRDGRALHILKGHEKRVWHAAFSPDGKTLVTASWDNTEHL